MSAPLHLGNAERRGRLVARQHLGRSARDVVSAVRGVAALHSSDPATPYLALRARIEGFEPADLDRGLFVERSLWRLHAMRRTLFIVPAAEGAVFVAGAGREIARRERRRVEEWLAGEVGVERVRGMLAELEARTLELLADGEERRTQDIASVIPELGLPITLGSGKWAARAPLGSRLLYLLAMEGRIVRTRPAGSWRSSHYGWAETSGWFDSVRGGGGHQREVAVAATSLADADADAARVELLRRYLAGHGPATLEDIRWWTGWTARHTAAALGAMRPQEVRLDVGGTAFVLADDTQAVAGAEEVVTLLPGLDPSPMGWKGRGWFLGPHAERLFDRSGNIGPTVWLGGRIVGGWAQRADGEVVFRLLEEIGAEATRTVAEEAAGLEAWFSGAVVTPRFRTPLERELHGGDGS